MDLEMLKNKVSSMQKLMSDNLYLFNENTEIKIYIKEIPDDLLDQFLPGNYPILTEMKKDGDIMKKRRHCNVSGPCGSIHLHGTEF